MTDNLQSLDAYKLTWSVLLGKWVEFAKSAVALPHDSQGMRLRESVPDLIMLQAVWFALGHMDELSPSEHALGTDRAAVLIEKHEANLRERWAPEHLPEGIEKILNDAHEILAKVSS